jgi:hypothetical protein
MYIRYLDLAQNHKKNTVPQNRFDFDYVNSLCGAAPDLNKFVHFDKHTDYLLGDMRRHSVRRLVLRTSDNYLNLAKSNLFLDLSLSAINLCLFTAQCHQAVSSEIPCV